MQPTPFRRGPAFFPQALDMNEGRLTKTVDRVLKCGERYGIVELLHPSLSCSQMSSEQFDDVDTIGNVVAIHRHFVISKASSRRIVAEAIIAGFENIIANLPMDLDPVKQ